MVVAMFFRFFNPLPMLRHANRMALFQRFVVVYFLNLIISNWICTLKLSTG